ncbi:hypothetical protein [Georgenia alba]|uniref:Ribosomally synthesized peptide with SipW-like signal peptide n=1 Tax=Georgenia alba TaxID=2233858 RepID=A0ABW2Q7J2_9MICO
MATTHRDPAQRPRRLRLPRPRTRAALAWGVLLSTGALITMAGFVDAEWAALGEDGIGTGTFDLRISTDGETWHDQTSPTEPLTVPIPGGDSLAPGGDPVSTEIHVRNASEVYTSSLVLDVTQDPEQDATAGAADLLAALELTVAADGGSPQTVGYADLENYRLPNLAAGETVTITLTMALPDTVGNELQGQRVPLLAELSGESVPS